MKVVLTRTVPEGVQNVQDQPFEECWRHAQNLLAQFGGDCGVEFLDSRLDPLIRTDRRCFSSWVVRRGRRLLETSEEFGLADDLTSNFVVESCRMPR